jgi:hypothetical protein
MRGLKLETEGGVLICLLAAYSAALNLLRIQSETLILLFLARIEYSACSSDVTLTRRYLAFASPSTKGGLPILAFGCFGVPVLLNDKGSDSQFR